MSALNSELDKAERLAEEGRLTDAEVFLRALFRARATLMHSFTTVTFKSPRATSPSRRNVRRALDLSVSDKDEWSARAYGSLGIIAQIRGDLEEAEELHQKSLQIQEELERRGGWRRPTGT